MFLAIPVLAIAAISSASIDESDDLHGCLAGLGDVDGDGTPDLAVASRRNGIHGRPRLVWVFSGRTGRPIQALHCDFESLRYGCAVARAGDVDGDGHADVLVGADDARVGEEEGAPEGAALVFSGHDGSMIRRIEAPEGSARFGYDVSGGLDLDGDRVPDFLVGAPESRTAYAFSGVDGSLLRSFRGRAIDSGGSAFGHSVAVVPDVDGDGCAEVLIGAPMITGNQPSDAAGTVSLFSGRSGERLLLLHDEDRPIGWAVGAVGDADGDGICDLFATALNCSTHVWSGRDGKLLHVVENQLAYLHSEGSTAAGVGDLDGDELADFVVGANETWEDPPDSGFGHAYSGRTGERIRVFWADRDGVDVCALGDVDADGIPDVAVFLRRAQVVRLLSGKDYSVITEIDLLAFDPRGVVARPDPEREVRRTPRAPRRTDARLAPAGDVDADGVPDLLVAKRLRRPIRELGPPSRVWVLSGRDGSLIHALEPAAISLRFGDSVHAAGDLDGDGHDDLLVGAPDHPFDVRLRDGSLSTHTGIVFAFSGKDGAMLNSWKAPASTDRFGESVAGGSDLDGDGIPDLVIGYPFGHEGKRGEVQVRSGADGSLLRSLRQDGVSRALLARRFAERVLLLPDRDGDGVEEVGVSIAPAGLEVYSGADGARLETLFGPLEELRLGVDLHQRWSRSRGAAASKLHVCLVGDLDGDGIADLAEAPPHGGAVRAISGVDFGTLWERELRGLESDDRGR